MFDDLTADEIEQLTTLTLVPSFRKGRGLVDAPGRRGRAKCKSPHCPLYLHALLADLRACADIARPQPAERAAIREAIGGLNLASLAPAELGALLATVGVEGASLPSAWPESTRR